MTELPELIKNDSRIGLPARDQDGKKCTILRVHRFSDGAESFTVDYGNMKTSTLAIGGYEHNHATTG